MFTKETDLLAQNYISYTHTSISKAALPNMSQSTGFHPLHCITLCAVQRLQDVLKSMPPVCFYEQQGQDQEKHYSTRGALDL